MKIAILYKINPGTIKFNKWHDGFTKAIDILKATYNDMQIQMINFYVNKNLELNNYDIVMIKWGFGSDMQHYAKNYFESKGKKCKIGLFISSIIKPTDNDLKFFDLLFYETEWYKQYAGLNRHKNIYHAFGIDTAVMKKMPEVEKKYDIIFVGAISKHKRPLNILKKEGTKLAVGFLEDNELVTKLKADGVNVINFVTFDNLAKLYNMSKCCYVPCTVDGGGERAVLEARACGINVLIENDNAKLKELIKSPLYDSHYYANQIRKGFLNTIKLK